VVEEPLGVFNPCHHHLSLVSRVLHLIPLGRVVEYDLVLGRHGVEVALNLNAEVLPLGGRSIKVLGHGVMALPSVGLDAMHVMLQFMHSASFLVIKLERLAPNFTV
jgi:hypothetical protein